MNCKPSLVVSLLLISLTVVPAWSQPSVNELFDLPLDDFLNVKVVSVSKKLEESLTAPGTVYTVTRQEIQQFGYRSLQEALKHIPSVYLYDPHSWVWGGQRGFISNFSQTLLLVDGREVNNLIAGEAFISRQFGTQNIERIEIVASPSSALYGANALAGVINVITKRATYDGDHSEVFLEGGSHHSFAGGGVFAKEIKGFRMRGSARYFRSDEEDFLDFVKDGNLYSRGWADNDLALPTITSYDNSSDALSLGFQLDHGGLYFGGDYYHNRMSQGLEKLRWNYTDAKDERDFLLMFGGYEDQLDDRTRLKAEYQYVRSFLWGQYQSALWPVARLQAADGVPIHVIPDVVHASTGEVLVGQDAVMDFYDSFAHYLVDQNIIDADQISAEDIDQYFTHIYTNKNSKGSQRHRVDLQLTRYQSSATTLDLGYSLDYLDYVGLAVVDAGTGQGASFDIPLDATKNEATFQSRKHGLYGQLLQELAEDRLWLNVGLRFENQNHYGKTNNLRLGLVWKPNNQNVFKLLYGEAFREPNVFELAGDPDLEPAELSMHELNYSRSLGSNARLGVTAYSGKVTNFLGSVGSLIGSGVGDVESQTVQGVEWQLNAKTGPLMFFANGSHIVRADQEVNVTATGLTDERDILGLPENKFNMGASHHFGGQYSIGLVYYQLESYRALSGNSAIDEPFTVEAYHDFKLTARIRDVRIRSLCFDAFLTVNNLTDHKNYHANIRRSGPHMFLQEGRTLVVGLQAGAFGMNTTEDWQ